MKRILKLSMVGLVACGVLWSCSQDETVATETANYYIPDGVISTDYAKSLNQAWNAKNAAIYSKAGMTKTDENQSFWWSLEDLRNYLAYAEQEAKEKGYQMDGVRVYLAAYPEKGNENTLFFAPTGYETAAKASFLNFSFQNGGGTIPIEPLNRGGGGTDGFPN
ncbi:hypothetical protein Q4566_14965 [Tamlana sp. 2_MG-2023]|uniref:hypothetical protein n=1 Tax=unclassified Tamlana TaxID=2614803 RepID=UPI0026E15EAC|nr:MULTISPECIES: hypothetical protein [unclassified Tamlana]MDO6761511.1 hypothetical protein [Tamlana sp. 2_MG-2023]MDO6792395.1 hypothetical protein [Tamlana sp. 1_MG-2023]